MSKWIRCSPCLSVTPFILGLLWHKSWPWIAFTQWHKLTLYFLFQLQNGEEFSHLHSEHQSSPWTSEKNHTVTSLNTILTIYSCIHTIYTCIHTWINCLTNPCHPLSAAMCKSELLFSSVMLQYLLPPSQVRACIKYQRGWNIFTWTK